MFDHSSKLLQRKKILVITQEGTHQMHLLELLHYIDIITGILSTLYSRSL